MTEDDCGEIEYLDEDEDLVHQYVQNVSSENYETSYREIPTPKIPSDPLLIERKPEKRKQRSEDEDSDYDPNEDLQLQRKKRTKIYYNKKPTLLKVQPQQNPRKNMFTSANDKSNQSSANKKLNDVDKRKNADIKIPNYEDALCLPGKAFKRDENDVKRLRNWNMLCLERLKFNDTVMTQVGPVVKSSKSFVFRNVQNAQGRVETSIWCKSSVENETGHKKSDVSQTVIPYFREKKIVRPYQLRKAPRSSTVNKYEIILTREKSKNDDYLVAYNPKDCLSAVYTSFMRDNIDSEIEEKDNRRMCLSETTCCKMCAPCYQVSWRGVRKTEKSSNIECSICSRTFVSVYNLLSHLKSHHTDIEVRQYRTVISETLAKYVEYHYKCRICQEQFEGIKELRAHVNNSHRGNEPFKCEVGNHMAN